MLNTSILFEYEIIVMNVTKTNLYKLTSKKYLSKLLRISDKRYFKQNYVVKQINPFIIADPKPRLIEAPSDLLKKIQIIIKNELAKIDIPDNVFSGVKGKSYISNAEFHCDSKYLFKIDLTAFFPCITRETVYAFFSDVLKTSPDISNILTNFVTVDLTLCDIKDQESVEKFLQLKGIKNTNHLISGSPTSQILSYLVNYKMFNELQSFCDKNGIIMSIYVDDITFSSKNKISHKNKEVIYNIISKHIYKLSRKKVKYYTGKYPKLVTGVVISPDGTLKVRNSLSNKVINELKHYKNNQEDTESLKRLRGLVVAARQSEPNKFQNISKLIRDASKKS